MTESINCRRPTYSYLTGDFLPSINACSRRESHKERSPNANYSVFSGPADEFAVRGEQTRSRVRCRSTRFKHHEANVPAGIVAPLRIYVIENADKTVTIILRRPSAVFTPYGNESLMPWRASLTLSSKRLPVMPRAGNATACLAKRGEKIIQLRRCWTILLPRSVFDCSPTFPGTGK